MVLWEVCPTSSNDGLNDREWPAQQIQWQMHIKNKHLDQYQVVWYVYQQLLKMDGQNDVLLDRLSDGLSTVTKLSNSTDCKYVSLSLSLYIYIYTTLIHVNKCQLGAATYSIQLIHWMMLAFLTASVRHSGMSVQTPYLSESWSVSCLSV